MSDHLGDQLSRRRRVAVVVTLGLLTGLGPFTIDMYLPSFPSLKRDLGITDPQVQVTLAATMIGFAVGQLLVGPLSDRLGRRWPLVTMSVLHVVASMLVASAPSYEALTVFRALQGIGAAGSAVVAMAMARDLFSGKALLRMMSRLALINGLAPILAPIVGSWLVTFMPWRGVFWVLAAYGAVLVVLVTVCIVETRPPAERTRGGASVVLAAYRRVLSDRLFVGSWLVLSFAFTALFAYVSSSSVLLQEGYGLTEREYGAVFAICSVGVFLGVQSGSRLSQLIGPIRILVPSTALMVVSAVAVVTVGETTRDPWPLVPAIFCFTFGFGATAPNAQVLGLQNHREDSGVAASLMGALNMALAAVVGPLVGSFDSTSPVPMGVAMLVCGVVSLTALWLVVQPRSVQVVLE